MAAQVNFLSHVLLTLRLLPSLARAEASRIVCTTSCFHFLGNCDLTNFNGEKGGGPLSGVKVTQQRRTRLFHRKLYSMLTGSKFYQNNKLFFQTSLTELQHRLIQHEEYRHITVNGVHPGYVNSGIWNLNSPMYLAEVILKLMAYYLGITVHQGSLAILHAATSVVCGPDPETQGVAVKGGLGGGRYFNRVWEEEPMPHTRDCDYRLRVWRKVNDELRLEEKGLLDVLGLYSTE